MPRGAIVMLPGGAGDVGIDDEGGLSHDNKFVVRTRALWLDQGFAVIIPDALEGQNMRGLRSSAAYAQVVVALVDFAHAQTPGPVFLVGTSQGSIAAMNGAAYLLAPALAGVVLTESVSRKSKSGETVFDASPGQVTVPALIVANKDSACRVAPAEDAPLIAAALTRAPEAKCKTRMRAREHRRRPAGPHDGLFELRRSGRCIALATSRLLVSSWLPWNRTGGCHEDRSLAKGASIEIGAASPRGD